MKNKNLTNILFLSFFHIGYIVLLPIYLIYFDWSWTAFTWGVILYITAGLGVTIGYHRFFSHKSFDTNTPIKILLLVMGTMSIQSSALKWSHDHRIHHAHTDTDKDPYSIKKGFWYAHMDGYLRKMGNSMKNSYPTL